MPSKQYYIGSPEGLRLSGQSLQVAKALSFELEGEVVTHRGIQGLIRLAADAEGIGQYVTLDSVLQELKDSGYLTPV